MEDVLLWSLVQNWFGQWFGLLRIDFGQFYGFVTVGDIYQARIHLRCITNVVNNKLAPAKRSDFHYESDITYYLNAVEAAQQLYLAAHQSHLTFLVDSWLKPLATVCMSIITLLLYSDASYVEPLNEESIFDDHSY